MPNFPVDEVGESYCLITKVPSHSAILCILILTGKDDEGSCGRDAPGRCTHGAHGLSTEGEQQRGAMEFYRGDKRACSMLAVELLFV